MEQSATCQRPESGVKRRRLAAQVKEVHLLSQRVHEDMYGLYHKYYEATSRELFISDLHDKDQVILLFDDAGTLRGFSTFKLIEFQWRGMPCRVIYSGDTIIHHNYWGEQSLAFTWIRKAGEIKREQPDVSLFWLLIVKGHRTYRYLKAFSRRYFPNHRDTTPKAEKALMDWLGCRLFGDSYQSDHGVIHFPSSRGQLRAEWAEPSAEAQERAEVAFFLQNNPGYREGDELLCLTELTPDNLRPLAKRLFEAGMKE